LSKKDEAPMNQSTFASELHDLTGFSALLPESRIVRIGNAIGREQLPNAGVEIFLNSKFPRSTPDIWIVREKPFNPSIMVLEFVAFPVLPVLAHSIIR
jgi:hypothetical protein